MGSFVLNVPVVGQGKDTWRCWHASAEMIWLYSQGRSGRAGPMFTLIKEWTDDKGLAANVTDFVRLAKAVGLMTVPRHSQYGSDDLAGMLQRFGPLWAAGKWYGPGHVVVLTGVHDNAIYINDPGNVGSKKAGTVEWFNQKLMNGIDGCLMSKNPKAY
jgi:hypothetical protein